MFRTQLGVLRIYLRSTPTPCSGFCKAQMQSRVADRLAPGSGSRILPSPVSVCSSPPPVSVQFSSVQFIQKRSTLNEAFHFFTSSSKTCGKQWGIVHRATVRATSTLQDMHTSTHIHIHIHYTSSDTHTLSSSSRISFHGRF